MNHAAVLASLLALTACSNVSQSAPGDWGYESGRQGPAPRNWGGYEPGQRAPTVISEVEAQTLGEQVVDLKAQRATLANNLPRVTDPATRARFARNIDELNAHLQLLEYRLRAAGRPVPR
jgi:hypothetical protein